MQNNPTVVLGEASEESDVEDTVTISQSNATNQARPSYTSLHDNNQTSSKSLPLETALQTTTTSIERPEPSSHVEGSRTSLSSNLFGAAARAPSLISKLVSYAPQSIIAAATLAVGLDQPYSTSSKSYNSFDDPQISLLQRNLQSKDDQLRLSVQHMFKHPFDKASNDLHNVSQRLIGVQRILLEVNVAVEKLKREERNIAMMTPRLDYWEISGTLGVRLELECEYCWFNPIEFETWAQSLMVCQAWFSIILLFFMVQK